MPWFDSSARAERRQRLAEIARLVLRPVVRDGRALGAAWARVARTGAATGAPHLVPEAPSPTEAAALRCELARHVLPFWRAHAVDPRGGYVVHLARDGAAFDRTRRHAAMQARMVYTFAVGHRVDPAAGDAARAEHGVRFLTERFLDGRYGGFRHTLDAHAGEKLAFDQAYVAIGLLAWVGVSGDPRARALAEDTLERTEALWDAARGGYAERGDRAFRVKNPAKTICVQLDMLAALLDLGDLTRARRVGEVVLARMIDGESGLALEQYTADWRYDPLATGDRVLIGHNLKAAYFFLELARRSGEPRFRAAAERLAERCLARGWDPAHGGFFQDVFRSGGVADDAKLWWPQCEGLALLYALAAATGSGRWLALARRHADFCRAAFQDAEHGGWITQTHRDGSARNDRKGGDYKAALHETQAWWLAAEALERAGSTRMGTSTGATTDAAATVPGAGVEPAMPYGGGF